MLCGQDIFLSTQERPATSLPYRPPVPSFRHGRSPPSSLQKFTFLAPAAASTSDRVSAAARRKSEKESV